MVKTKYWDDFHLILNSNILSDVERQKRLDGLKCMISFDERQQKWLWNENVTALVFDILESTNPFLLDKIKQKILTSKDYKVIKDKVNDVGLIQIVLIVLLGAFHNKQKIPEQIYKIQILNFISFHLEHENDGWDIVTEVNNMLLDVIDNKKAVKMVGLNNFDKFEVSIYRCIEIILEELKDNDWINVELSNELDQHRVAFLRGDTTTGYGHNVISLNVDINQYIEELEMLQNRVWPSLVPPQIDTDKRVERSEFIKGVYIIERTDLLFKSLQYTANIKYRYDVDLCLEAVNNVDSTNFLLYKNKTDDELSSNVLSSKKKLDHHRLATKENWYVTRSYLKCFLMYIESHNLNLIPWFKLLLKKVNTKRKRLREPELSIFDTLPELNMVSDVLNDTNCHRFLKRFLHFVSAKLEESEFNYKTIIHNFSIWYNDNLHSFKAEEIGFKYKAMLVFNYLDLSALTHFKIITKSFDQKKYNYVDFWKKYLANIENFDLNFAAVIKEDEELRSRRAQAESEWGNYSNVKFKTHVMELFERHWVYFKPHLTITGRLAFEGFSPNPHVGTLFRFAKIENEKLTNRGLTHVKLALSHALGNNFLQENEHLSWLKDNDKDLESFAKGKAAGFVYYKAYKHALEFGESDTPIRVDQCASALSILGHLANCPYYLKITNVTNNAEMVETYSVIGRDIVYPAVKGLVEDWENDSSILGDDSKEKILEVTKRYVLAAVVEKKFIKYIIMPTAYNITYVGIAKKIISLLKKKESAFNWDGLEDHPMLTRLSLVIYHSVSGASKKVAMLRKFINETQKRITKLCSRLPVTDLDLKDWQKKLEQPIRKELHEKYLFHLNWEITKKKGSKVKNNKKKNNKGEFVIKNALGEKTVSKVRYFKGIGTGTSIWKKEGNNNVLIADDVIVYDPKISYKHMDLDHIFYKDYASSVIYMTTIKHKDCVTLYDYKHKSDIIKSVWDAKRCYSKPIKVKVIGNQTDIGQSNRALLAILVQQFDSAIIRELIRLCTEQDGFTPTTIHDSGSCSPNNIDRLMDNFKKAFITVFGDGKKTNKGLLEDVWLNPTLKNLEKFVEAEKINKVKKFWDESWEDMPETLINLNEIEKSKNHWTYE